MSKTKHGVRSPMTSDMQANPTHRMPSTSGTTEVIPGTSPKPAPISSPNQTQATVGPSHKGYNDQKRD